MDYYCGVDQRSSVFAIVKKENRRIERQTGGNTIPRNCELQIFKIRDFAHFEIFDSFSISIIPQFLG